MLTIKARYHDGDTVTTRFNGTAREALSYYLSGSLHNVGLGPGDRYKLLTGITILREENQ